MRMMFYLVIDGEIVARVNGQMEFGARALGARSINADPRDPSVIKKINDLVKARDFWMPFGSCILEERVDDYIVNPKNIDSRYMTIGFDLRFLHAKIFLLRYILTIIQRVLMLLSERIIRHITNFLELLKPGPELGSFKSSFNLHGEPVVESQRMRRAP